MEQLLYDMLPELGEKMGSADSIIDARFPHIAKNIIIMWGSSECMDYLDSLINYTPTSDRPDRQGFPFHAIIELNHIMSIHQEKFPTIKSRYSIRANDPW